MKVNMTFVISVDDSPYSAISLPADQPLGQEGAALEGKVSGEALWAFQLPVPLTSSTLAPGLSMPLAPSPT
jgi:hypothetical protein